MQPNGIISSASSSQYMNTANRVYYYISVCEPFPLKCLQRGPGYDHLCLLLYQPNTDLI